MTPLSSVKSCASWPVPTLAKLLAHRVEDEQAWRDGLEPVSANLARWLQMLAMFHEDHPYPDGWFEYKRATPARTLF